MSDVTPARERAFLYDLKTSQIKHPAPIMVELKRAWSSAATPLSIVRPAHQAIPPQNRDVFVNDRETAVTQYTADFVQHEAWIVCVVQHIAKQDGIEALISNRKVPAVVWQVIDGSGSAFADVETNHSRSEHSAQMMRDETVAAADVE
jgi:hypothetical protein